MVSDVPVGAFLSGGLDSSLLVAMLAKRVGVRNLPTFTVGLSYAQFDEAPHARAVARLYGTEHHEQTLSPSLVESAARPGLSPGRAVRPALAVHYHVAELAHRHVKVVIGGDGGDELFGGYDRYYGNLYAEPLRHVPAALRRCVLGPALSLVPEGGWYKSEGHQLRWLHRTIVPVGRRALRAQPLATSTSTARERSGPVRLPKRRRHSPALDAEAAIREPFERAQGDLLDRMLYADSRKCACRIIR